MRISILREYFKTGHKEKHAKLIISHSAFNERLFIFKLILIINDF